MYYSDKVILSLIHKELTQYWQNPDKKMSKMSLRDINWQLKNKDIKLALNTIWAHHRKGWLREKSPKNAKSGGLTKY